MPAKNLNMILIVLSLVFSVFSKDNETSKKTDMVSSASKQTRVTKDHVEESDTLVLTARLIEIPGTMPSNDLYDYVFVMKYRVLAVKKGVYSEKEIYVGHYNPLIPRKLIKGKMDSLVNGNIEKFTAGSKHQLTLITPIEKVWKDAVEDNYIEIEQPRYFALIADEMK
jgi:hypothetical protein